MKTPSTSEKIFWPPGLQANSLCPQAMDDHPEKGMVWRILTCGGWARKSKGTPL
jgi:hypothetical protein